VTALRTVLVLVAAAAAAVVVVVRVRNATAVARLATLRVHALRHPEVVQEAIAVVGEEGTVPLVVVVVAAAAAAGWGTRSAVGETDASGGAEPA
jgi:hypothetical protein